MELERALALLAGLAALFGGMAGWGALLHKKAGLCADFTPAVVCSLFVCLLYAGGLAGQLWPAALGCVGSGLLLLLWWLAAGLRGKTLAADIKSLASPGVLFFAFAAVAGFFLMRGPMPMVGDSYNHWATVAKLMSHADRLARDGDTVIVFQSYPPGSALFLYLVTRLAGFSESRLVWGQLVLTLAGLAALFAAGQKRRGVFPVVAACLCAFLFLGQTDLYDLLVDALVGILAAAGAAVILYHRRQPLRAALFCLPLQAACILVKNSGVFFAAVNLALLAWFALRRRRQMPRWTWAAFAAAALLPFLALVLWNGHVDRAFPLGAESFHAMRAGRLGANLADLTAGQMWEIAGILVRRTLSLGNGYARSLLVWAAALVALAAWQWKTRRAQAKNLLQCLLFCSAVYALYAVALYGTYVASMTYHEAVVLACYTRYASSVFIYVVGVMFCVLLEVWTALEQRAQRCAMAAGLAVPLAVSVAATVQLAFFVPRPYQGTLYQTIDELTDPLWPGGSEHSYFVVGPQEGILAGTTGSYLKYKLFTMDTQVVDDPPSAAWVLEAAEGYDYLLVLEDSAAMDELFAGYPRFQDDESHVGLYHLPLW